MRIFGGMDRRPQLLKYYRKCLKAKLLKSWQSTVEERQHQTVLEWSKAFFGDVEDVIKEQVSFNISASFVTLGRELTVNKQDRTFLRNILPSSGSHNPLL